MSDNIQLGNHAENLVAQHLEQLGFAVIERQYKKKYGEIDLIAQKNELLVFVFAASASFCKCFILFSIHLFLHS